MNRLDNVKRMPSERMLEEDDRNHNKPKEKKMKRIELNTKIRSISRMHNKWNNQSAYDKICKGFGLGNLSLY